MAAAGRYDFTINAGATFSKTLTFKDDEGVEIDLTGVTFRGKIAALAGGTVLASFTCTILDQGTNTGEMSFSLTAAETASLPKDTQLYPDRRKKRLAYDIERVNADDTIDRILEGVIEVSPEVTVDDED